MATDAKYWLLAEAVANSEQVLSIYAAPEWQELNDDGRCWIEAIVRSTSERFRIALEAIQSAVIDGHVCDDVAWFDKITTLHDYIEEVLRPPRSAVVSDLFDCPLGGIDDERALR